MHGTTCSFAVVGTLLVSGLPLQSGPVPAAVGDLSYLSGVRIDAIVGLDVLARTSFTIDCRVTANMAAGEAPSSSTDIVIDPIPERAEIRAALIAAVALLPAAPRRIAVMDVTEASPGVRAHLLTLDAFTVEDHAVIYVVRQSELLKRARTGAGVYRAMLATVLWHEMAHLAGADEHDARQAEEKLWTGMVRDGVVDPLTGLRYLQALKERRDDQRLGGR